MTNTKIEKVVEEFDDILEDILENGSITTFKDAVELKYWIKQALLTAHKQGKKDRDEEVMKWIEKNIGNTGDEPLIDRGYDFALDDLKTFINQNNGI